MADLRPLTTTSRDSVRYLHRGDTGLRRNLDIDYRVITTRIISSSEGNYLCAIAKRSTQNTILSGPETYVSEDDQYVKKWNYAV